MLNQYLHDKTIQLKTSVSNYQQALEIASAPLLSAGIITTRYLNSILQRHNSLGVYYVLAPGLAMPHARPQEGALAVGLSLLKLQQGVNFGSDDFDPVDIVIMLAAADNHSHIAMLSALAELFSSDEDMQLLHQATTIQEIQKIINRY